MGIRITAEQVPSFWEAIKYATINSEQVVGEYREKYLNVLLYQLLSDKAQCFVSLDSNRQLQALAITRVMLDEITEKRTLFIKCLYSFKVRPVSSWEADFKVIKKYAVKRDCTSITAWTNNDKVVNLAEAVGFRERLKSFILNLDGGA